MLPLHQPVSLSRVKLKVVHTNKPPLSSTIITQKSKKENYKKVTEDVYNQVKNKENSRPCRSVGEKGSGCQKAVQRGIANISRGL